MILLITLVILVILSTLGYTLTVRVAARRHRDQYIIDCYKARHACASGLKYALASLGELQFQLISRPNEPDFSDVFALSEPEYQKLLTQVDANLVGDSNLPEQSPEEGAVEAKDKKGVQKAKELKGTKGARKGEKKLSGEKAKAKGETTLRRNRMDPNDINDVNDLNDRFVSDQTRPEIPGPYGPRWPLVVEPMEFEVGSTRVKVEIEDENAKYPLSWVLLADEKFQAEAAVGWTTFCEWMGYTSDEIVQLRTDLAKVAKIKPFKTEFKTEAQAAEPPANLRSRTSRPSTAATGTAAARRTPAQKPVPAAVQMERQNKEFARLLHSSLVDADLLARPSIDSDTRKESALKYLGLWATRHVNINTAPRQVLEATLAFGSVADAPKIADVIIQQRHTKPIADVNELKRTAFQYTAALDKCKDFITTTSTVFTVKVTAVSGVATATATAAVSKEADKIKRIAIISD